MCRSPCLDLVLDLVLVHFFVDLFFRASPSPVTFALALVIAFALVVVLLSWDALLHVRWDEPLMLAAAK